jgi:hypothetical protein
MNASRFFLKFTTLLLAILLLGACAPKATNPTQELIGSWTSTVTKDDILRVVPDFLQDYLCDNSGTFVWEFKADGTFTGDQTALEECPIPAQTHIEDTWSVEGNLVTFAKGTPDQEIYEWAVESDLLTFKHKSGNCIPCKAINTANPWKRIR